MKVLSTIHRDIAPLKTLSSTDSSLFYIVVFCLFDSFDNKLVLFPITKYNYYHRKLQM